MENVWKHRTGERCLRSSSYGRWRRKRKTRPPPEKHLTLYRKKEKRNAKPGHARSRLTHRSSDAIPACIAAAPAMPPIEQAHTLAPSPPSPISNECMQGRLPQPSSSTTPRRRTFRPGTRACGIPLPQGSHKAQQMSNNDRISYTSPVRCMLPLASRVTDSARELGAHRHWAATC